MGVIMTGIGRLSVSIVDACCWVIVAVIIVEVLAYEFVHKGLWAVSNGRVLSFCDSIYSMYRYRLLKPIYLEDDVSSTGSGGSVIHRKRNNNGLRPRATSVYALLSPSNSPKRRIALVAGATLCKYGGGTLVSLMLGETPVWLQGYRHIMSFLGAFAVMQMFPGDLPFRFLRRSILVQAVLFWACALYQLRKIVFCLTNSAISDDQWYLKVVIAFMALEGNSILRKLDSLRVGQQLEKLLYRIFSIHHLPNNLKYVVSQHLPGVVAIMLVGAGQKCWLCPNTSWVDYFGRPWTPIPIKVKGEDHSYTNLFQIGNSSPLGLTWIEEFWFYILEYALHPVALLLLNFRYLRQLDWSQLIKPSKPTIKID